MTVGLFCPVSRSCLSAKTFSGGMQVVQVMPCLDVKDGRVVKGIRFVNLRGARDPVEAAEASCWEGADELMFLDIFATVENRKTRSEWTEKLCEVVTIPFAVGGGIVSLDDMKALFDFEKMPMVQRKDMTWK